MDFRIKSSVAAAGSFVGYFAGLNGATGSNSFNPGVNDRHCNIRFGIYAGIYYVTMELAKYFDTPMWLIDTNVDAEVRNSAWFWFSISCDAYQNVKTYINGVEKASSKLPDNYSHTAIRRFYLGDDEPRNGLGLAKLVMTHARLRIGTTTPDINI
jgi:hypothetical protein